MEEDKSQIIINESKNVGILYEFTEEETAIIENSVK